MRPPAQRQRDEEPEEGRHQREPGVADRQRDDAVDVRRDRVHAPNRPSFAPRMASMTSYSVAVPIRTPASSVTTHRPLGLDSAEFNRSRSGSVREAAVEDRLTSLSSIKSPRRLAVSTQPSGARFSSTTRIHRPWVDGIVDTGCPTVIVGSSLSLSRSSELWKPSARYPRADP